MDTEIANVSRAAAQSGSPQAWTPQPSSGQNTLLDCLAGWSTWQYLVTFLLGIVVYDQVMYLKRKGSIAGPAFKIPLMGPFLQAIHPKFDAYLAQWASGPLSCVSVFHKFVVLASDRDLAHKVFKSPSYAEPCIVPIAKDIIGHKSWVFLQGKAHAEYRRGLTPLFTNKAMATYLPVQEKVFTDYFDRFVTASQANRGRPMAFMSMFREINCALSCRTFFGDYISQKAVKRIADDFYLATAALELVNIPLSMYIPFTKTWLGKRTADAVHVEFAKCAAACKANMATGAKPTCIVDHWVLHMMESKRYHERVAAGETDVEKPTNLIREFTNEEIGETLFTFLFASQDASSSATTWLFQILAQRPDVLDRLREENLAARGGDRNRPFDLPMLESLSYTNAVIKELLRHRPPVIFVPYLATKNFPVTPDYTVPKGSMVIPSCWPALHDPDVYPNPEVFEPERWISGDAESKTKNWLVFGAGPHECLAKRYVPLSMAAMIGKAALELEWTHHATEKSEEIRVFATLFPMDGCQLVFSKRV
ncbi:cytochrome P450 [Aspergillus clavatus NRRL 1]|uniref:Cytochrome P450 n=1 Tax=Aspergillus clavatus (strain ATCC 1007 / CBS 513.65 / DSM 816 / NCTC 3887 / NRRL 1 / QM 1276 / 107) TaxID=344612 RepID=A1CDW5_ASPCL|nr:cytochrome P450 [Aspergillus clavatus NRRL 1]EAW12042.1 cytochrome P450 [Aspergillus clavatus NRRL 1]